MKYAWFLAIIFFLCCVNICFASSQNNQIDSSHTTSWSSSDGKNTVITVPSKNKTYYFNNDSHKLCFTFSLSGLWKATREPGLLASMDDKNQVGVLLLSEKDLEKYENKDILSRSVTAHIKSFEKMHKSPVVNSKIEIFKSSYGQSIKWTGDWHVMHNGETFLARVVRFMVVLKSGWVAVITASRNTDADYTAKEIINSLKYTDKADCYAQELRRLK